MIVFPLPAGTYSWTSGYGPRGGGFHHGVDLGAPSGTPVHAPISGAVTTGYESGGAGNWIWVSGGGVVWKVFHLSGYVMTSGQAQAGQHVAMVENTGASSGAHAHVELHLGGPSNPVDPTSELHAAEQAGSYPGQPSYPPEEDDVTPEQMNTIGAWHWDTREYCRQAVQSACDAIAQWHHDTRTVILQGTQQLLVANSSGKVVETIEVEADAGDYVNSAPLEVAVPEPP